MPFFSSKNSRFAESFVISRVYQRKDKGCNEGSALQPCSTDRSIGRNQEIEIDVGGKARKIEIDATRNKAEIPSSRLSRRKFFLAQGMVSVKREVYLKRESVKPVCFLRISLSNVPRRIVGAISTRVREDALRDHLENWQAAERFRFALEGKRSRITASKPSRYPGVGRQSSFPQGPWPSNKS